MSGQNYNEEAALAAALEASLMTAEEDDKRRKQKYGHLYTTMIPPLASNLVGTTASSRSLTGSPITVTGGILADASLSNSQPSLKNVGRTNSNPTQGSIARPRPQSLKGKGNDRLDAAFGNSNSGSLYPSVSSAASSVSPTIPPRPDAVQSKLPPPPLPVVGPNARVGNNVQNIAQRYGNNAALMDNSSVNRGVTFRQAQCSSNLGIGEQPLIKLSPPVRPSDPFGFDINSLDPLNHQVRTSQGQVQVNSGSIGFEAWGMQGTSAGPGQSNPLYGVNTNPFQNTAPGNYYTGNGAQQFMGQPQGGTLQRNIPSSSGFGVGSYNTIQTTRGMNNVRTALGANTAAAQGGIAQRGASPAAEVQSQTPAFGATGGHAQPQQVQSPASSVSSQDQAMADKHLSELSDLMDFSIDENDDFMTLCSFDPLESIDQPTPASDADVNLSFFAEPSAENAMPVPGPVTRPASTTSQAAGFTLPLTKAVVASDKYSAFRQPSPIMAIKSPEEEHYEKLTIMKINEMVKKSPSPVETPSSEPAVEECALQDPFSIEALTRELEEKRARHAEEQALRQALLRRNNAEERARHERMEQLRAQEEEVQRKLFRRNSHMVKGQESRYEMLHHVRETADEEIQTFCQMVSRLKKQFSHDDPVTNKGLVISPRMRHGTYQNMTVKVAVVTKYCSEPVIFTCDLNASVEHVISHVILSLTDDLGSTSVDDFILKVHGQSEFFLNTAVLGDYEYVQSCLKLDRDIKLNLYRLCDIPRSLLRTSEDDRQPVFVPKPREVDGEIKVTRDKLNILMETFYKEVEKLRDQALQMGCGKVHCHAVIQTVKAVCATLNRVETFEIIKAVKRLRAITLERTLHPATPADRDAFVYVTSEGESVGSVVDSEIKRLAEMDDLHRALEDITKAVKNVIELYCRTYHTDFRFESVTNVVKDKVSLIDVPENLIVHIASAHRIPPKWFTKFDDFRVICGLYQGGRKLSQEVITKIKSAQSDGFQDTIIWDEWIQFPNVMLCLLPREARLCFTLLGVKIYTAEQGQKVSHVNTPLGWVALQVFNHKFECAQGSQLLGLWVGESATPVGTSQSNTESPNTVLLQVNLPDFDCDIVFPTVMEPGESMQQDFRALHPTDQENLQLILNKDSITRLTPPELEFLWEKRNFLYNHPAALAKVLKAVPRWDFLSLQEIYTMIQDWSPLNPIQAMELLLPSFPDSHVRTKAIHWIRHLTNDELCDYLPQLVQALKFESYHNSSLARFLLERSVLSIRLAHQLYWLLKEVAENMRYRKRYQLLFGALLSVVGSSLRHEFSKQEDLTRMLAAIAEKVKAAKDKDAVLQRELENMWEFMQQDESIRLPINPSMEIMGVDAKSCSYFTSNAFPLKLVLKNIDPTAEPMYSMFKVGDDLRQDMITMQLVRVMDKMWLKHALDLKILTFRCQATGPKRGLVEIITESETLRKIQVKHGHGLAGSFKDRPIAEWLQMQNPTELEYQKAVDNFIASCAGYCVATYVLGIGDRHNDNIMIKQSGHMFHIDFGKFLGDAQMFGNIKRDRVPFVLTSDMAYVINGGGKSSHKFQVFVDLCCQAFNILRNHTSLFLNLFSLMSNSGIPGLNENAAKYVQKSLMPELDDSEATAEFTKMIHDSLKSYTTQINFFIHNLAQRKFTGHQEGAILSFAPKVYSLQTDGRITNVEVFGYQKRYNPEKYYIYIIKVDRDKQKVPTFVFRRYSEIQELHHKLVVMFPLARLPSLPGKVLIGRTHVKTVAEARKGEVEKFLKQIVDLAHEVSECDLVYTFFHPMLRDEQDIDKTNLQKLKNEPSERASSRTIGGQVKLSILYKNDALTVMVMHVKNLCGQAGDAPDPYVKTYLLPDSMKTTKRKTKIAKETFHPTYNEMLLYRLPLEEVRERTLQVTVWNYNTFEENEFLGAMHLRIAELDLTKETTGWFPLQTLHKITTA